MKSLYELTSEYLAITNILNKIDDEDMDESIELMLDKIETDIQTKSINIAAFIKNVEHYENGLKEAEENLRRRRKVAENKINRIKKYLKENMIACKINKIISPQFEIILKKKPVSVYIENESALDEKYIRTKVIKEPDKIAIKDDLSKGVKVEGAKFSEVDFTVIIT